MFLGPKTRFQVCLAYGKNNFAPDGNGTPNRLNTIYNTYIRVKTKTTKVNKQKLGIFDRNVSRGTFGPKTVCGYSGLI